MKRVLIFFIIICVMGSAFSQSYGDYWLDLTYQEKYDAIGYMLMGIEAQVFYMSDLLDKLEKNEFLDHERTQFIKDHNPLFMKRMENLDSYFWMDKLDEFYADESNKNYDLGSALFITIILYVGLYE